MLRTCDLSCAFRKFSYSRFFFWQFSSAALRSLINLLALSRS